MTFNYKKSVLGIAGIFIVLILLIVGIIYLNKNEKTTSTQPETSKNSASPAQLKVPELSQNTIVRDGPGKLSIAIPEDLNRYLDGEIETLPNSTELELHAQDTYFKDNKLAPVGVQFYITIAEEKYTEDSHCGSNYRINEIVNKKNIIINNFSFTQITEQSKFDNSYEGITVFQITERNMCRYVNITASSAPADYLRAIAKQNPAISKSQVELTISDMQRSRDYLNKLSQQLIKTVSAK